MNDGSARLLEGAEALGIVGLGLLWLGWQIVWVAPLPRQLRTRLPRNESENGKHKVATAAPGSAAAFQLFWIDQYGWLGLTLAVVGGVVAVGAWLW